MKKPLNKIKIVLSTVGITILSFFSKVIAQFSRPEQEYSVQGLYGVPEYGVPSTGLRINIIIKIAQRALIGITFTIGIINLIKIKKINKKGHKIKKIENNGQSPKKVKIRLLCLILFVIIGMGLLIPTLLLKK